MLTIVQFVMYASSDAIITAHLPVSNKFIKVYAFSFLATCIGHFNQRYFVAAIVTLWTIMLICLYWNWSMVFLVVPRVTIPSQVWTVMMPHVALIAGFLTFSQFMAVFFFVTSLTSWLFVSYLGEYFREIIAFNQHCF